jgi:PAS domain S-box-containing protein
MLNLSQLKSPERISTVFLEVMNSMSTGVSFRLLEEGERVQARTLEIATARSSFGYLVLEGDPDGMQDGSGALIRNAVRMLAVVLENRVRETLLADENLRLEAAIRECTSELAQVNKGLIKEISERKRVESTRDTMLEALRESEACYKELADSITDVFFAMDKDLRCIYWNRACKELTDISAKDAIGNSLYELFPDVRGTKIEELYLEVLRTQQPRSLVSEYQLGDETLFLEIIAYPSRSGLSVFAKNITERVWADKELMRYHDHLEELVRDRTRELERVQAELIRQERLSALGQLMATIAHEIRNPLSTVRAAVFSLGEAIEWGQTDRVERALQLSERNILRCDRIIMELLDYARGRTLEPVPTHVDTWLEAVLDEQDIPEGIICIKELSCDIEVPIDREHLRRAIVNVVNNAVDALQDNAAAGNHLTISTHIGDRPGPRLEIQVKDTGPGMPDDVLSRVFEPMFSTKGFGAGLGLPIVKDIMEQHRGGIEIQSEVGAGTTVVLWLPVAHSR